MQTASLQDSINELIGLYAEARFSDMEQRARRLLATAPDLAIVSELLGMALSGQRRYWEALPFLEQAACGDPSDSQFWENLALCHCQLRQFAQAEAPLRKSLALRPGSADALATLGRVLFCLDRPDEARPVLAQAIAIAPGHAHARIHLARVLAEDGRLAEAGQHLRHAIAVDPKLAGAHCELGIVLLRMSDWSAAEASFRRALAIDPARLVAHANLAWLIGHQERQVEAVAAARAALAAIGDIAREVAADDVGSLDLIAEVFEAAGFSDEAIAVYRAASKLKDEPKRALAAIHAARRACDWSYAASLERQACRVGEEGTAEAGDPGILLLLPQATASAQLIAGRKYAQRLARTMSPLVSRRPAAASGERRVRIGYLSSDFFNHATAHLIAGVIEAHDRGRFEIAAYDFSPPSDDDYRRRLERAFDALVPLRSLSNQDAAQRIADDGLDILLDLKGWTKGHRGAILAARPAPLQVHWLGYPGSLGAPWIDYVIADKVVAPPGCEAQFSEQIIRLPHCYQPNDGRRAVGAAVDRRACGLPEAAFVFCSFNQIIKLSAQVFDIWLALLRAVDGSVLWLLRPDEAAVEKLRLQARSAGVDPGRIIFAPFSGVSEHRARIAQADLALDCFPCGSHTTASDVLWAGVPLVAWRGDTFASRVSASLLEAAGLADLITASPDDYFRLCLRLATDAGEILRLKSRVKAAQRSPLFDTARFTRDLERAFEVILERQRAGLPPDHVNIA
jgi:predicted O-linked N-acetylglucosamine transferase (SPINDLY family)